MCIVAVYTHSGIVDVGGCDCHSGDRNRNQAIDGHQNTRCPSSTLFSPCTSTHCMLPCRQTLYTRGVVVVMVLITSKAMSIFYETFVTIQLRHEVRDGILLIVTPMVLFFVVPFRASTLRCADATKCVCVMSRVMCGQKKLQLNSTKFLVTCVRLSHQKIKLL